MPEIGGSTFPQLRITGDGVIERTGASGTDVNLITSKGAGDAEYRYVLRTDGRMYFGGGSIAPEIIVRRLSTGILQVISQLQVSGYSFKGERSAASGVTIQSVVTGDTSARYQRRADGKMEWGPGNAAGDVVLERSTANVLKILDQFYISGNELKVYNTAESSPAFETLASGDAFTRFSMTGGGLFQWGPGNVGKDCDLSRRAANILNTPDRMEVGTLGVGNHAAGTTPGNCQNKVEIFDAAGNSIGFVAVYDAIT